MAAGALSSISATLGRHSLGVTALGCEEYATLVSEMLDMEQLRRSGQQRQILVQRFDAVAQVVGFIMLQDTANGGWCSQLHKCYPEAVTA